MNDARHADGADDLVPETADVPAFEVVALRESFAVSVGWPAQPGSVRRDAAGVAALLHYAPGRWLLLGAAGLEARAEAAERPEACTVVDVTGKWQAVRAGGADALRRLAGAGNLPLLLRGRECAATTLVDCPVLVARDGAGFVLWVRRSYVEALLAALRAPPA